MNSILADVTRSQLKKQVPDFRAGDTLKVAVRIVEGDKERIQNFEGVCISRRGAGMDETFMVRRTSFGVAMERIFPVHSPRVDSITVTRQGKSRRSKLYYLRDLSGKKARLKETRRKRLDRGALVDVELAKEPVVAAAPAPEPAAPVEAEAAPVTEEAPVAEEAAPKATEEKSAE